MFFRCISEYTSNTCVWFVTGLFVFITIQSNASYAANTSSFIQNESGIVSIEVENHHEKAIQGEHDWQAVNRSGNSGVGALQALPNKGSTYNNTYVTNSPRLDFQVNFVRTGIHYVWIRGLANNGRDDSLHVGLNGAAVNSSDRISRFSSTWRWSRSTMDGSRAMFNVPTAGIHTVNIWMREDGMVIDKLVLATNAGFVPTGVGPAESPQVDQNTGTLPTSDTQAPSVPTGLSGTTLDTIQIDLSWLDSKDTGNSGLAGYKIYRDGVEIATTAAPSYSDTGLQPVTLYTYTVQAYDNAGNVSEHSPPISVTTLSSISPQGEAISSILPQGEAMIRVNAGGGDHIDSTGALWSADFGYNTGDVAITSSQISGTADDVLFQTVRWDRQPAPELSYSFPVPNGEYDVNLYFAESYVFSAGERVFDVHMEGAPLLNNVDVYGEVGANTTLVKTASVTVVDDELNIEFSHQVENPLISAIEVIFIPDTTPPTVPTGLSGTPLGTTQIDLSWLESSDTGNSGLAGYKIYRDGVEIATTAAPSYADTGLQPNTLYTFTVQTYDNAGNVSEHSTPISVTTLASVLPQGEATIRVNAGGGDYIDSTGALWSADIGYNTGDVATTASQIGGTADDALFQTVRWDRQPLPELSYRFPVPNGQYSVNLYFAESYVFAEGGRVFDVGMEGTLVMNNLDIYSEVGANTVLIKTLPVTVSDGELNIEFLHQVENPLISAIEVFSLHTTNSGTNVRINAGGGEFTDSNGNSWSADTGYNTGNVAITTLQISGTTDDALFQTVRWDRQPEPELSYSLPVPNGQYDVNLYFAESYVFATGGRVFDVYMEGTPVLDNVDVYSEAGANTALVKTVPIAVTDGQLTIDFIHQVENPTVSAIEVVQLDNGGTSGGGGGANGANNTPSIGGTPATTVNANTAYSFIPNASDVDGDILTFSITNKPNWATFNANTGALTGTPTAADGGTTTNIMINVSDGTGTASLAAFNITVNVASFGTAALSWTPPTTNIDGTGLTDLAGYRIHYGTSVGTYPNTIDVDTPAITSFVVENLPSGNYFFVVTAYAISGNESPFSNVASKSISIP